MHYHNITISHWGVGHLHRITLDQGREGLGPSGSS